MKDCPPKWCAMAVLQSYNYANCKICIIQGYLDKVAALVVGHFFGTACRNIQFVVDLIDSWRLRHGLSVNSNKTIFTKRSLLSGDGENNPSARRRSLISGSYFRYEASFDKYNEAETSLLMGLGSGSLPGITGAMNTITSATLNVGHNFQILDIRVYILSTVLTAAHKLILLGLWDVRGTECCKKYWDN